MVQDITDNNSVSGEEPLPILSPLPQNGESSNDSEQHAGFGKEALSLSSVTSTSSVPADDKESQILTERRQEIVDLLKTSYGAEGDLWYIISHVFLKTFLYLQVDSWSQLANELGPLDMNLIVDPMGNLYPEKDEPVPTYNVPPQVFIKLTEWFEVKGDPVVRTLVKNPETGSIEVERYPTLFALHQLVKNTPQRHGRYQSSHHNYNHHPTSFFLSRIRTIGELLETVRSQIKLEQKFRVWVIAPLNDVGETIPPSITIPYFVRSIPRKSLILPGLFEATLSSQGLANQKFHLLVETAEKPNRNSLLSFPLDTYLLSIKLEAQRLDAVTGRSTTGGSGGTVGFSNLGNTCYMNSALQCLLHVPEVNNYFFLDIHNKELNTTNALGFKGEVAMAFASLLHKAFDPTSLVSSVSPRDFKYTIGHYSSMFLGYQQQDSQEFLSWLLDALHEDLNRILNKPYSEKPELSDDDIGNQRAIMELAEKCWMQHKQRNDSVIVDLFTGLYQSTLVCPDCGKTSITFDPFSDLTLPLPIEKKWFHTITVVDMSDKLSLNKIKTLEISLPKSSTFDSLVLYLSEFFHLPRHYFFVFELYNDAIIKNFQEEYQQLKFFPINELLAEDDDHYVYIIPHDPSRDIIVPVFSTLEDSDPSYKMVHAFGIPLFLVLDENERLDYAVVQSKIEELTRYLEVDSFESSPEDDKMDEDSTKESRPFYSVKYIDEIKMRHTFRMRPRPDTDSSLQAPVTRLNFNRLPDLLERASADEQKFYIKSQSDSPIEKEADSPIENEKDEETTEASDYVLVENSKSPASKSPVKLLDDETDGDGFANLGLLFDSTTTLPTPCEVSESETGSLGDIANSSQPSPSEDMLVTKHMVLVCQWRNAAYAQVFDKDEAKAWKNKLSIRNEAVEASRLKAEKQRRTTVLLVDCLQSFSTPEVLGEFDLWYCPRCKDHKRATKTIQIWSTGDILTIHLKRFQSARSFSDKIDLTVDFPIEGLDMSNFVAGGDESLIYDLIAVDNHYGGLGGGHYTASVKNFRDGKWYYFNDSHVSPIEDPTQCITGAAYLLFYRKRSSAPLGGPKLESLFSEGSQEYNRTFTQFELTVVDLQQQVEKYDEEEAQTGKEDEEVPSSNKKSRSPAAENDPYFKGDDDSLFNKRKQRLISKDPELEREDSELESS